MVDKKFNPKKINKLNDPERLNFQNPDLIWQTLGLKQPKVLVDIGAGTGFFAMPFCDKLKDGIVYACDTSDVMLDWMKKNLPPDYSGKIIPVKCEETKIPLASDFADLVYMINLYHELENSSATLADTVRLLKKGGKLLVIDWKDEETVMGPPQSIRVPLETIKQQCSDAGLVNVQHVDCLPFHCFVTGEKD